LASFEAYTAVMIEVEAFWVVAPCIVLVGYKRFRHLSSGWSGTTLHGITTQKTSTWIS